MASASDSLLLNVRGRDDLRVFVKSKSKIRIPHVTTQKTEKNLFPPRSLHLSNSKLVQHISNYSKRIDRNTNKKKFVNGD